MPSGRQYLIAWGTLVSDESCCEAILLGKAAHGPMQEGEEGEAREGQGARMILSKAVKVGRDPS